MANFFEAFMERRFFIFLVCLTFTFYMVQQRFAPQTTPPVVEEVLPQKITQAVATEAQTASYYVIENEFQQVVVSTRGGVISEINLPFKTKSNPNSIVLPVALDTELVEKSPKNALFPFQESFSADGTNYPQKTGGYYPLLRRSLELGGTLLQVSPQAQLLSLTSEFPELTTLSYNVVSHTQDEIILKVERQGRTITKRIAFPAYSSEVPYTLDIDITIDGERKGIWFGAGVPEVELFSGSPSPAVKYQIFRKGNAQVDQVDLPKEVLTMSALMPNWACNSNGFFGLIFDPFLGQATGLRVEKETPLQAPSKFLILSPKEEYPGYSVTMPFNALEKTLKMRLFAGPFQGDLLNKVDAYYSKIDHVKRSDLSACQSFHGWFSFISEPFAKFLLILMKFFHRMFGSWALSIILITVVLRVLMSPLNTWSMRSMKKMQEIGPKIKAVQDKYKKDPVRAQTEVLALYRDNKVNPVSGCLPLLIQMPFLIGMFDLLKSSFELRGASFIPGWISDLSAPDVLFSWSYSIPFIGNSFHLLPVALGATMFWQQKLTASPTATDMTDQQRQQRAVGTMMTVVMTVLFYNFPSGLNIYWISSMLLGILQQWQINRKK